MKQQPTISTERDRQRIAKRYRQIMDVPEDILITIRVKNLAKELTKIVVSDASGDLQQPEMNL